jgi:hypothetical protein
MTTVFVSYRRADTTDAAEQLYRLLSAELPGAQILLDVRSLEPGRDFLRQLRDQVRSADWVVVVIGDHWRAVDAEGHSRLQDRDDVVRAEVETAMTLGVPLLPVLVSGARMPAVTDLPIEVAGVTRRNALPFAAASAATDAARIASVVARPSADSGRSPMPSRFVGNWIRGTSTGAVSYEFFAGGTYLLMRQLQQIRPVGTYLFETWEEGLVDVDERAGTMSLDPLRAAASQTDPGNPANSYQVMSRETVRRTLSWRFAGPGGGLLVLAGPDEDERAAYQQP